MKKTKFNLGFTLLAASSLLAVSACAKPEPLTADNDVACRDRDGNIVDDDYCERGGGGGNGAFMFLWLSSNGYKSRYGKYPKSYNPKSYAGKTRSGFSKAYGGGTSRGGFGSSGRGMSSGS
jgi:hypothetical protein